MFLTTNRLEDIDEAFKSRFAMILHYPSLTQDYRAKIWENHIRDAGVPLEWDRAEKCRDLAKRYELDGRAIIGRHLVQVSSMICQQRDEPLSEDIIEELFELRYGGKSDIRRYLTLPNAE